MKHANRVVDIICLATENICTTINIECQAFEKKSWILLKKNCSESFPNTHSAFQSSDLAGINSALQSLSSS